MLNVLLVFVYLAVTAVTASLFWRYRHASPVFWLPAALSLMAIGTFALSDSRLESDRVYIAMHFVAIISFTTAALLYFTTHNLPQAHSLYTAKEETPDTHDSKAVCTFLFVVSALITVAYYVLVGYNVAILILSGGLDSDYSDVRLATYSGGDYFAPGYVNQFKNVLLPLTTVAIAAWLKQSGLNAMFYSFCAIGFPFLAVALAGTGQRAFVVFTLFAILFGFALYNIGRPGRLNLLRLALYGLPVLIVYGFMTSAYRGISEGSVGEISSAMLERFTSVQQEGGLVGFRYIYQLDSAAFSDWLQDIKGILPSEQGSTIAHEVHALMYGDDRGTVPLSSIGSAYYNGGVAGVVLLFAALGILYSYLYRRFLTGKRTLLRSLSYGFLFFYLSIYVSGSPTILLDNGALTAVVFLLLSKIRVGRRGGQRMVVRREPASVR